MNRKDLQFRRMQGNVITVYVFVLGRIVAPPPESLRLKDNARKGQRCGIILNKCRLQHGGKRWLLGCRKDNDTIDS